MRIEKTEVMNLRGAIRGMRNPLESWDKMDTNYKRGSLGKNDLELAKKLCKAGSDHRKFMRQIFVSVDITAPLYWWKQFDTYKIGVTQNSTSTMHKIHDKEITIDDFQIENIKDKNYFQELVEVLEDFRKEYNRTNNKDYWYKLIELLPSSYLQKRTVTLNYEVLVNIYSSRKNHKLSEWHKFCDWIESLPNFEIIKTASEE